MPKTYFEANNYKSMSNKDLIKKQEELEIKISKAESGFIPKDLVESMMEMRNAISNEIDERLDAGTMSEDELDEDF